MADVIDVDHFRKTLGGDVRIVTRGELPKGLQEKDTWQVAKTKWLGSPEVRICWSCRTPYETVYELLEG